MILSIIFLWMKLTSLFLFFARFIINVSSPVVLFFLFFEYTCTTDRQLVRMFVLYATRKNKQSEIAHVFLEHVCFFCVCLFEIEID